MAAVDDLPFACSEQGCTMKFTNEDHLMVHLQRHQMSLTLNAGSGNKFLFQDQTPTPTKFLRNCEEIGLFNDINKNPFDDAFSKAVTEGKTKLATTPSNESPSVLGVSHEPDTLNTPTPHLQNDTPLKKRYRRYESLEPAPEFVPLPGPAEEDVHSDVSASKGTTRHASSDTGNENYEAKANISDPAGKRLKTEQIDRISLSSGSIDNPGSQESVTLEDTRHSSFDQDVSDRSFRSDQIISPADNLHPLSRDSAVSRDSLMSPPGSVHGISRDSVLSPGQHVDSEYMMTSRPEPVQKLEEAGSMETDIVGGNTPLNLTSAGSTPTESKIAVKPLVSRPTVLSTGLNRLAQEAEQPASSSAYFLQVMIQTSEGKLVPVHIPAAVSNTMSDTLATDAVPMDTAVATLASPGGSLSTGNLATANEYLAASPAGLPHLAAVSGNLATNTETVANAANTVVKAEIQPLLITSSVAVTSTTGTVNASSLTKQKIKQRVLQSQNLSSPSGGNMPLLTEAVERVTSHKIHNQTRRDSWLSRDSSQSSFEVEYQDADSTNMYKHSANFTQATTPESDADDKRRKFLERNRAAAARCRNKKKQWVTNLERKAEELQSTNTRLQNEVTQLKAEMVQLKSLLLAHKDCPITLQQRQAGQLKLYSDSVETGAVSLDSQSKMGTKLVSLAAAPVKTGLTNKNESSSNNAPRGQDSDQWSTTHVKILPATSQNLLTSASSLAIDLTKLS